MTKRYFRKGAAIFIITASGSVVFLPSSVHAMRPTVKPGNAPHSLELENKFKTEVSIRKHKGDRIEKRQELLDFLDITNQEFVWYRTEGKSLYEIAELQGKSKEEIKAFLENQMINRINANPKLSEEKKQNMLSRVGETAESFLNHKR